MTLTLLNIQDKYCAEKNLPIYFNSRHHCPTPPHRPPHRFRCYIPLLRQMTGRYSWAACTCLYIPLATQTHRAEEQLLV